MTLYDIIEEKSDRPPYFSRRIAAIPNGDPLPQNTGRDFTWVRTRFAISEDEARHVVNSMLKAKC